MHGFTRSLERRLEALEKRLGAVLEPETAAVRARRLDLVKAAHAGREPADLREEERPVFVQIAATVPIALELIADGAVDRLDGEPSGTVDPLDTMMLEDEDDEEDEEDRGENY